MRKCFWWLVSLFKQCICAFRQNDLVFNISVDYFLSADSVLDILDLSLKKEMCFEMLLWWTHISNEKPGGLI